MIACTAIEHEATLVTHDAALKDGAIGGFVVEDCSIRLRDVRSISQTTSGTGVTGGYGVRAE